MKSTIPRGAKDTERSTDRRSARRVRSKLVARGESMFEVPESAPQPKVRSQCQERRAASPPPTPPTPTARGASARHHRLIASTHRCGKSSAHPFAAPHRSTMVDATRRCQRVRCTSGAPRAARSLLCRRGRLCRIARPVGIICGRLDCLPIIPIVRPLTQREARPQLQKASTISEMTGSACDDEVRLAFSRSDLLLWSASNSDLNSVKRCDGFTNLQVWQQRAAHADLLVLGLGHHFPGSLGGAEQHSRCDHEVLPPGSPTRTGLNVHCRIAMHAFFPQNLNHTLNSVIQARQANTRGLRPPELSIALVGTTTPVSGCSRFNEPISLSTYASKSYEHRRTVDSPMW